MMKFLALFIFSLSLTVTASVCKATCTASDCESYKTCTSHPTFGIGSQAAQALGCLSQVPKGCDPSKDCTF